MKKIILMFAVLSSFVKCGGGETPINSLPPYRMGFIIDASGVKDPEVKYIKVAIKCIDKILPKYDFWPLGTPFMNHSLQREEYTVDGKTYYFSGVSAQLNYGNGAVRYTVNKDRIFELKIYKNNELFLTKKITLRSNRDPDLKGRWPEDPNNLFFVGHTDKVEVDNMDYVKEINVGDRQGRALIIEIPDKPIKK